MNVSVSIYDVRNKRVEFFVFQRYYLVVAAHIILKNTIKSLTETIFLSEHVIRVH